MADIVARVRKLLALSSSDNIHEAAAAMNQAQRLMTAHGLDQAVLEAEDEAPPASIEQEVIERFGTKVRWRGVIARGLSDANNAQAYYRGAALMIVGPTDAIRIVVYMHKWLCSEVARLCEKAFAEELSAGEFAGSARRWKNSFCLGAAGELQRRIEDGANRGQWNANQRAHAQSEAAIVKLNNGLARIERQKQDIKTFIEAAGVKLRIGARGRSKRLLSAYDQGKTAGGGMPLGGRHLAIGSGSEGRK